MLVCNNCSAPLHVKDILNKRFKPLPQNTHTYEFNCGFCYSTNHNKDLRWFDDDDLGDFMLI